jgi:integrase/recombinase XerD
MLKYCERSIRKQSIIHFLASTGVRPAALVDPVLKIKHLKSMPNLNDPINQPHYCYAVKVYDESREGYWAFLTPEARKIIDRYLNGRKLTGEKLDDESPLFTTLGSRWNTKNQYLTDENMQEILGRIVKGSKIIRKKTGNRYDKSLVYMFRKRFNTVLKINNNVNSNIAEKLMAHKKGLDGTYLQPSLDQFYAEFFKAISDLTIEDTERLRATNKILEKEKSELRQLNEEKEQIIEDYKKLEARTRRLEQSSSLIQRNT